MRMALALLTLAAASAAPAQSTRPATAPATAPASASALPPDSAYCVVDADGHLSIGGQRARFWGAIGSFPGKQLTIDGDAYFNQRDAIRRAKMVGFNMFRIWHLEYSDKGAKGDLSRTDVSDFFMAECARQGVRIWAAGFGGGAVYEDEIATAVKVIDEPATADAWSAAIKSMVREDWWTNKKKAVNLLTPAVAWDPRLEALAIESMRRKANHVNVHTGMRHADDPTIAIWELTNEQWWMSNMFSGQWQKLPAYFRQSLIAKWNAFLLKKYGSQDALAKAWGFVFPGEDLAAGTVLLAPLSSAQQAAQLNDTNPAALEVFKTIATPIGRNECTAARSADVIEFLLETIISHKQRFSSQLKTWGKSARMSPVVFDTGIGQSIHAQYMQMHGDAVAHASYMEGIQINSANAIPVTDKRWPFYSGLDKLPQLCNDVPWLEHNRPVGKPFLCYETQFGSPSKYRAEWPLRVAALGSVQDWDAACYHYWTFDNYKPVARDRYAGLELAKPGPGAFQYDYTSDELEQAGMRAAGALFRHQLVAPAPKPTVFRYGRAALYDPRSMDYGGDYNHTGLMDMMETAYASGMRLVIDPNQKEFVKTEGPVARRDHFNKGCPLKPSDQITYDYQRGFVMMDSPGAASWTGFWGQYGQAAVKFANGVALSDVVHVDPPGTAFPAGEEKFVSFTLASEDGKPLKECSKAVLVLVASSSNTDLAFPKKADGTFETKYGKAPVLVTRVAASVSAPQAAGMKYRMIDFNENVLAEGVVGADGTLKVPADKPVWLVELTR
jgi:hypothetical protein